MKTFSQKIDKQVAFITKMRNLGKIEQKEYYDLTTIMEQLRLEYFRIRGYLEDLER